MASPAPSSASSGDLEDILERELERDMSSSPEKVETEREGTVENEEAGAKTIRAIGGKGKSSRYPIACRCSTIDPASKSTSVQVQLCPAFNDLKGLNV
jgi:hypothetical protein